MYIYVHIPMKNLNIGITINLPCSNEEIDELIKYSKHMNSLQIMFNKTTLDNGLTEQMLLLKKYFKHIYVHASYQINIGSELMTIETDGNGFYSTSLDLLIAECGLAKKLSAGGVILHVGTNVKNLHYEPHVYNNMVKFIVEMFVKLNAKKINVNILLETPAGQSGSLCADLNDFVDFIKRFSKTDFYPKLNICIDTCHLFQAGYDLNDLHVQKSVVGLLESVRDKIKLIHLNDSYYGVGKRVDKHERLGKGYIKPSRLMKFACVYSNVPMIMETSYPYDDQLKLIVC